LTLPSQPELQAQWLDNGRVLRISAKRLARGVWVDLGAIDAQLSENAFDLLPGEHVDIAVESKADLASLQAALKLTSLVDAVQPAAAETKP
jgi:beta-mannosidase